MGRASLAEIIGTEPVESVTTPEPEPEPQPEPEPTVETGEDPAPPAEEPEVQEDAGEADDNVEQANVPIGALKEERAKRQELERQVAELRGRTDAFVEMQQGKEEPVASEENAEELEQQFYRDPVAFQKKQIEQLRSEWGQELMATRISASEEAARRYYKDYDEVVAHFVEAAKANPMLIQKMREDPSPGDFAYQHGKVYAETKSVGTLDDLKAKYIAEGKELAIKEMREKGSVGEASAITPTNATARGGGAQPTQTFTGPTPLEKLVPRR